MKRTTKKKPPFVVKQYTATTTTLASFPREETFNDALLLLHSSDKPLQDSSKRFGFMKVQTRPPTCLSPPATVHPPMEHHLTITPKHSSLKRRLHRMNVSMKNDQKLHAQKNATLNGKSFNASLSIVDQMISKDYHQRLKKKQQQNTLFPSTAAAPPPPSSPPPSKQYSKSLPTASGGITLSPIKTKKPPPMTVLAGKPMSSTEALLLQKRGLLNKLQRARKKKNNANMFAANIHQLEQEIETLSGNHRCNQVEEDYTEFMISPLKKQTRPLPPAPPPLKPYKPTGHPSEHPHNDYNDTDLTLFKFARTGDWADKLEHARDKPNKEPPATKFATTTKTTKTTKNTQLTKFSTTTSNTTTTTTQHKKHPMNHLFDASKSSNEIIRMPTKDLHSSPPSNAAAAAATQVFQLGSPTAAPVGSRHSSTVSRGILRTAGTSESSRRVTWSPLPDQHHPSSKALERTNQQRTNQRTKQQRHNKKSSLSHSSSAPLAQPSLDPSHVLDIPSTAEMRRRLMSRRSEYRMVMGRKTGAEIKKRQMKRRLSALQATTRAIGRLKVAQKRKELQKKNEQKRRNSVLGQFVTSNL